MSLADDILNDIQYDINNGNYEKDSFDFWGTVIERADSYLIYTKDIVDYWMDVSEDNPEIVELMINDIMEDIAGNISEDDIDWPETEDHTARRTSQNRRRAHRISRPSRPLPRHSASRVRANRARRGSSAYKRADETHNGWSNYETWYIKVILDNDYELYKKQDSIYSTDELVGMVRNHPLNDLSYSDMEKVNWSEILIDIVENRRESRNSHTAHNRKRLANRRRAMNAARARRFR